MRLLMRVLSHVPMSRAGASTPSGFPEAEPANTRAGFWCASLPLSTAYSTCVPQGAGERSDRTVGKPTKALRGCRASLSLASEVALAGRSEDRADMPAPPPVYGRPTVAPAIGSR